jgi:ferredoxin
MKICVHEELCAGHARCGAAAPDVYVLDDEGYNRMGEFEVPPGLEQQARAGVQACPEYAIEILGE